LYHIFNNLILFDSAFLAGSVNYIQILRISPVSVTCECDREEKNEIW